LIEESHASPLPDRDDICQLGIFVSVAVLSGGRAAAILDGWIMAAIFISTVMIWQDLPRGIVRWIVAAFYALAFVTMCYFGWGAPDEAGLAPRVVSSMFAGILGCVLVAIGVVTVKGMARLFAKLKNFGIGRTRDVKRTREVTELKLIELKPSALQSEAGRPCEPIFGTGAPAALYLVVSCLVLIFLAQWLTDGHP
jgi:hypothetical protein